MLGLFTSDSSEKQFGKVWQGCGGTYFITAQQILVKVGIAKIRLLLNLDWILMASQPVAVTSVVIYQVKINVIF